MITKWNEVNSGTFEYIMNCYKEDEDWTLNTIIEVQDPVAILSDNNERRFYFGGSSLIDDLDSYKTFDQPYLELLETVRSQEGNMDISPLCFCALEDKNPTMIPIFMHNNFNIILFQLLGDTFNRNVKLNRLIDLGTNKWFIKKENKRYVDLNRYSFTKYEDGEKMYRIRTIDYSTWKENILEFIKGNELKYINEDAKFETTKKNE